MEFKDQLKARMNQAELSELGLADRCGVSHQTVRNWLSGATLPESPLVIIRMCMELGCQFHDLFPMPEA